MQPELLPEEAQAVGLVSDRRLRIVVKYDEGCPRAVVGYTGRTDIFEVVEVNEKIRLVIREKAGEWPDNPRRSDAGDEGESVNAKFKVQNAKLRKF